MRSRHRPPRDAERTDLAVASPISSESRVAPPGVVASRIRVSGVHRDKLKRERPLDGAPQAAPHPAGGSVRLARRRSTHSKHPQREEGIGRHHPPASRARARDPSAPHFAGLFDRTCWWKIPASSVTAFDKTVEILGYLYGSEFGLGGGGLSSRFPSAVNLEPSVDPAADPLAANRVVRREIDFDPAKTRIIISIRVSDPRSLVDVEKRDKASSQQLLTAAMALRDMRESSGVRASVGEFVVHVATGSKRRHEDAYFVAFAPHPGGHLHRALVSLIEGEDVDAARRNFEAGAAAAEAKTRLADAERVLRNLSGDASEATSNATHARDACARATTDSARATEQLRLVGNQYDVDWNLLHGEAFAGITQPIIASEPPSDPNTNASTTFVFGRGYADFIRKVDHLLDNREPYSPSAIVLFAVAWLDRIPPRAMEALRSNGRLPSPRSARPRRRRFSGRTREPSRVRSRAARDSPTWTSNTTDPPRGITTNSRGSRSRCAISWSRSRRRRHSERWSWRRFRSAR